MDSILASLMLAVGSRDDASAEFKHVTFSATSLIARASQVEPLLPSKETLLLRDIASPSRAEFTYMHYYAKASKPRGVNLYTLQRVDT